MESNADSSLQLLNKTFRRADFRWSAFTLPMICSVLASGFEALTMGLLFPAVLGIISGDFSFLSSWESLAFLKLENHMLRNSFAVLLVVACLLFVVTVVRSLSLYAGYILVSRQTNELIYQLRKILFKRYLHFGKLFYDKHNTGRMFHILTEATGRAGSMVWQLYTTTCSALTLLAYLGILLWLSPPLTLLVLLIFPSLYFALRTIMRKTSSASVLHMQELIAAVKGVQNTLTNIGLVKAYCAEKTESERFAQTAQNVSYLQYQIDKQKVRIAPIQEIVLLTFLLGLVVLTFLVSGHDEKSVATLMLFIVVLRRASGQISGLGSAWQTLSALRGDLSELHSYFETAETFAIPDGTESAQTFKNVVAFENVSFVYAGTDSGVSNLSFELKQGETTALVGATGAGKSTCLNLLMRFYDPSSGRISLDGKDIRSFSRASWRNLFALVSQDPYLFNDSFRANICFGLAELPDEQKLNHILQMACLDEVVNKLPDGIETIIGDRGVQLSGGERQRVAIARAILKESQIILLDEATSALDSKTEKQIQRALERLLKGKTVISVAHRLSTIAHADSILVLEAGSLEEAGSFDQLIDKKGIFFDYWDRQVGLRS